MSDETKKDLRPDVLMEIQAGEHGDAITYVQAIEVLDRTDPIRKLWPEVVEALGDCEKNLRVMHGATGRDEWDSSVPSTFEAWKRAKDLLTRIREIEGGERGP